MKEEQKLNLHLFAGIYFLLFFVAVVFNEGDPYLKFPKLGETFTQLMLADAFLGFGIGIVIVGITHFLTTRTNLFQDLLQNFQKILGTLSFSEIFFIAAFSSLAEEFFFRGLVQGKFGIVFASILFGALHTGPGKKYIPWTAFGIVMGFVLGALYEWRDNLVLPITIHFVVNIANLFLITRKKVGVTPVNN